MRKWKILLITVLSLWCVTLYLLGQPGPGFAIKGEPSDQGTVKQVKPQDTAELNILHAKNIVRLHSLYHQMTVTFKNKDVDKLKDHLLALQQALDLVESTEQNHPQWAPLWAQRRAKLLALSKEMEVHVLDLNKDHDKRNG